MRVHKEYVYLRWLTYAPNCNWLPLQGCDGGLLIDGPGTEKTAAPNLSVKGYDLITAIKTALEEMCPGVVSCSDIQILATRDAVALAGGPPYAVRTGRRDRRQSRASDVRLPAPDYTAAQAVAYYARLGMNALETVALLGAHTVGATRCSAIKNSRLYGYGGKPGATDPGMDPATASVYKKWVCPNVSSSDGNAVFLDDQWSALKVENHYYKNLQQVQLTRTPVPPLSALLLYLLIRLLNFLLL